MSVITEPSICIPRTLNNVTWRNVKETFETLIGPGTVDRVDIVKNNSDNQQFCRIFVHFRYWPVKDQTVKKIRDRLMDGETIKIVYDSPWFWKCVTSRISKPERTAPKIAPFVEFDDEKHTKTDKKREDNQDDDSENSDVDEKKDEKKHVDETKHVDEKKHIDEKKHVDEKKHEKKQVTGSSEN